MSDESKCMFEGARRGGVVIGRKTVRHAVPCLAEIGKLKLKFIRKNAQKNALCFALLKII